MKICLGLLAGLLIGAAGMWAYLRHGASAEPSEAEKPPNARQEMRLQHGTNRESFLNLDAATQKLMGLKVAAVEPARLAPEVKGYGRVLDPTPLAGLMVERATARAALEASSKEYQRLKTLYDQNQNVSTRVLETAEANLKRDKIQVEAMQTKLVLALGKEVAGKPDLPEFVNQLIALETALVRVDLPLGQALQIPPRHGRLAVLLAPEIILSSKFLGPATSADSHTQGQGFLFLVTSNPPLPGAAVLGWLKIPGAEQQGVVVPRPAVVRHGGGIFVYVQTGETSFGRKQVTLDRPLESGWFVRHGLAPKEKVVVVGAQQLLSEEFRE